TQVAAERRRTRYGSDTNAAGTLDGFVAIIGVIGQADDAPVVLFAPVIKILPPQDAYVRTAASGRVSQMGIRGHRSGVVLAPATLGSKVRLRYGGMIAEKRRVRVRRAKFTEVE